MPTKRRLPQWALAIALAVSPATFAFADEPKPQQRNTEAPASVEQPIPGEKPAPIEKPVTPPPEKSDKPMPMPMPVEPPPPVERKLDKPKPAPEKPVVAPPQPDKPAKDKPASAKADDPEFPTPAQLFERMKKLKAERAAMTKVAYFDMAAMPVLEAPLSFSLFADTTPFTLRAWVQRLHAARDDKDVRGVLLNLGSGAPFNLAQAQEVRDALVELRKAGKKTFVYADSYDTIGYTVASGATNVCLLEGGEIMIPGIGLEATFYRGIFDKVGVKADYVQIGEYKGADESYTRTEASPELKGELNKLTDAMYEQLVDDISHNRNVSREAVKQMIDDTILTARDAKQRGFVDHLIHQDQLRKLMTDELGNQIDLLANYGQERGPAEAGTNPMSLLANLFAPRLAAAPEDGAKPAKPEVALIYAEGVISDGDGDGGLFSEGGVASEEMRKALRQAARDDNIKAIVIRIDSPGGSALASEVMWQAARAAAAKKPVIISVGSMAASGGYYLASAGDYIFADPSGIVGSIGVVGGKFVYKDLFDKLGINTESFKRGRNAGLFSSNAPFDERQRRMVTNWMKGTYDQFTDRVMTTRKGKIKDIDQVARGRIFIARQAKELGMIDEIGGINTAVAFAAKRGKLNGDDPKSYDVKIIPQPKTLADYLGGAFGGMGGGGNSDTLMPLRPKIELSPDSLLRTLDPATRQVLHQQLQMIDLLQKRPVVLLSPYVVTVK